MFRRKNNRFIKPNYSKIKELSYENSDDVREIIVESRSGFNTIEMVLIMIVSIAFGVVVGSSLSFFQETKKEEKVSPDLEELVFTYNNILDTYYEDVNADDLLDAAVDGMVSSLGDPYSLYMDRDTTTNFQETVDGSYVGIGIQFGMNEQGQFVVLDVTLHSSAESSGIQKGDVVVAVDGKSVSGLSLDDLANMIEGEVGTTVELSISRGEESLVKKVTRQEVDLISVSSKIYHEEQGNVGYLSLDSFAANTYQQFKEELLDLEEESIDGLIVDVRANPGGHLNQTKKILELFMDKGDVLYQIEAKGKKSKVKDETKDSRSYPIVILIDSSSASAAEILASSFKDSYVDATLVGNVTYGKGTVQKAYTLSNGSSFKYTTEKWLTPKGEWIDAKGIQPDFDVDLGTTDTQFEKALEVIVNKL